MSENQSLPSRQRGPSETRGRRAGRRSSSSWPAAYQ
jgi:hypothetical protein